MPNQPTQITIAHELARLSEALVRALEDLDLSEAERIVAERGQILESIAAGQRSDEQNLAAIVDATRAIREADARSQKALGREIDSLRDELAEVKTGARALRAYSPADALAPGFVDRRD